MNCHLLRCFCPQLGDKEHKHKKGKAENNDERHWGNIQITISAEVVAGQKDNYIGSTVIVSQCHSVLHVPGELTLIILLSLFFCLFYTLYIPFTFIIFCPSLFFAPFPASSRHFFQCWSCLHGLHLSSLQVSVWAYCWRCVVVLHPYHHFFLHSQPGCFPDSGKNGIAHRECRRPGQTDRDSLRDTGLRLH